MASKNIAIIGAGNSGIVAYNACLEQGFTATAFEKTDQICGLWLYREEVTEGCSSIYKSLTVNSNKEMTAFSTYPPPKDFPNYMPHSKMAQYIEQYADRIGFKNIVKLRHEVINCEPNSDYEESGKWRLTVKDLVNDKVISEVFDGVMICTGQMQKKQLPQIDGQDQFKGTIIHSKEYKEKKVYENKTVVIVGCGISSGDIAVDLSDISKVYMVVRSGAWVTSRLGPFGLPFDYFGLRRAFFNLPYSWLNLGAEILAGLRINHRFYGLKPKHRYFDQLVFFTEYLPLKIMTGQVTIKQEIECFTENGVIFKGEKEETKCDVVILATGYRREYPFLEDSIFKAHNFDINENYLDLYKNQFMPHLKHPKTLSFIGLALVQGSVLPIAELQCRWFAHLMADKAKLPNQKKMLKLTKARKKWVIKNFPQRETKYFDSYWIPTADSLAKKIDAKPNLVKYFFTDPKLWWYLYFGPCLPYQYRIDGPNKWPEARDTILTVKRRICAPTRTKINSKYDK